jgi:hypothetical protein
MEEGQGRQALTRTPVLGSTCSLRRTTGPGSYSSTGSVNVALKEEHLTSVTSLSPSSLYTSRHSSPANADVVQMDEGEILPAFTLHWWAGEGGGGDEEEEGAHRHLDASTQVRCVPKYDRSSKQQRCVAMGTTHEWGWLVLPSILYLQPRRWGDGERGCPKVAGCRQEINVEVQILAGHRSYSEHTTGQSRSCEEVGHLHKGLVQPPRYTS